MRKTRPKQVNGPFVTFNCYSSKLGADVIKLAYLLTIKLECLPLAELSSLAYTNKAGA